MVTGFFVMNPATWAKISPADQAAIDKLSGEFAARHFGKYWDTEDDKSLAAQKALGVQMVTANAAFVAYGAQTGLLPVLVLHLVLAPVNAWRLWQLLRLSAPSSSPPSRPWPARPTERQGSS
jgi:hypothetical protein